MKKSLLAVAVAAALPAVAFAQSNVTMYGIADAGITSVSNGANSGLRLDSGIMSTSRWGVRGSEDLGGGLSAIFNLEAGFKQDTGSGTTPGTTGLDFSRRAIVGLAGGFGEVRLGRDYTPAFSMAGSWDALGYGLYGNTLNYTAIGAGTSVRFSNGIYYSTPAMGGFTAAVGYAFGENLADSSFDRGFSLSAGYAAGPLNVGAYIENTNGATGLTSKKVGLGGGYNFGAFGLKGGWQKFNGPANGDNITFINIGGNVAVGAGTVLAQFSRASGEASQRNNTFGLAYTYPMSKRTTLYATFGRSANDKSGGTNAGVLRSSDNTIAPAANETTARGIGFGVRHSF
jgi:predicted porin